MFDPERILSVLHSHEVDFVLIGGLAAAVRGSPLTTTDVDITPDRSEANLSRLAAALRELGARIRTSDSDGVIFPVDAAFLAAQPKMLNLVTVAGDLDLTFVPSGFDAGFPDLADEADPLELVAGRSTNVARLGVIIRSKRAAGRAKDLAALPYLMALQDESGEV